MDDLMNVMRILRSSRGCPWDRKQTYRSLMTCLLEETYEILDAVSQAQWQNVREEIGDLLCVSGMLMAIAEERRDFSYRDVIQGAVDKMKRRHPHVFGTRHKVRTAHEAYRVWHEAKHAEHSVRARRSAVDDIGVVYPALLRAFKIHKRVVKAGFTWPSAGSMMKKTREELREMERAMMRTRTKRMKRIKEEYGDFLFMVAGWGRSIGVCPEVALRGAIGKFMRRFRKLESMVRRARRTMSDYSPHELIRLWHDVKKNKTA